MMAEYDPIPDDDGANEYAVLTYCRDERQAEQFRDVLIDHDIAAMLPESDAEQWVTPDGDLAVLVPAGALDEARDILDEIALIEKMDIADPDFDGGDDEDEDITENMQPLSSEGYYLDDDEAPPLLGDSEDAY